MTAGLHAERRTASFTLIELLVVIAIIAVLASLLLPVLSKAKAKAQGIACLDHLKQLQTAWLLYALDNNDMICPNRSTGSGPDPLVWRASPGSWVIGNAQLDASPTNIENGVLYAYTKSLGVYKCPADRSFTVRAPKVARNRSYALDFLLNGTTPVWRDVARKTKVNQIIAPPPTSVFAFLDVSERMICSCEWGESMDDTWDDVPADRHNMGANLSFVDGHVEHHRWRYPKAIQMCGTLAQSKDDLEDLRWLLERQPGP